MFSMWIFGFTLVSLRYSVLTYNLDVNNAKVFNSPTILIDKRSSYFGFSVALYANKKDSLLLVGAPRANTTTIKGVIEPGVVYQCPINDTCKEWTFDKTGNGRHERYPDIYQNKNNGWIGAAIAVENRTDPRIVVCSPRYRNKMFMNGICYWIAVKNIESKKLIGTIDFKLERAGQAGFSLHITSNESQQALLGSPGILLGRGIPMLVVKSLDNKMQTLIPAIENGIVTHDSYFGYSVTSGCYFKQGELWFASGAPRAADMHGNVIIFRFPNESKQPLLVKKKVAGEQYGEYFGAALSSCDLNGDGKDELIIGAPQWAKDVNEGRIYVFTTSYNEIFVKQLFDGEVPESRFGSVITCLGDIDYDGYADIAVGAPYEKQFGAIYIFNGNSNGLPKFYSQKIIGRQFGENVRGFGISISEPRDINGDKYSDIAVGAYLSDQAILIKSKSVVKITTNLKYSEKEKLLSNSTFFIINVCTCYDTINEPKYLRIVKFLKIDQMYGRALYHDVGGNNGSVYKFYDMLHKSKTLCSPIKLHLEKNIKNVIDPLEISVSVTLEEDSQSKNKETNSHVPCTSCPVINKYLSKTEDFIKLPFTLDCGENDICISDIRVELSTNLEFDNKFIIGSTTTVKFMINVSNYGEPAYQSKIFVYIPEILSLASVPLSCMESSYLHNTLEVICDIGNPLRQNKTLTLELDMSKVQFGIDHVELWTNFTTQSKRKDSRNTGTLLTIYFDVDVDVVVAGKVNGDSYSYFYKNEKEQLTNLQFEHIYEVQKFGVSPIDKVILAISMPTYWKDSSGDIPIININKTIGQMNGQQFNCMHSNYTPSTSLIDRPKIPPINFDLDTQEKFTLATNFSINLPPENRSVYINCTNTNVHCTYIQCNLGPFTDFSSVAKLSLVLDLYLINLKSNMIEEKDIILFVSNGSVSIMQPYNIHQKFGHKPDSTIVTTMFLGSPITKPVATWIIALSIIIGIVLLIFLIF
ncbi:integrin alpha-5-like [Hylaeus volcanicus]|uniref:integrin alpha-5-like n=1 Tax=Hylaeus volcanicus TaxID=313075 RepID=UPI0023B79E31|nr:integrin alpha-5-like [Hylaeus volcanicus]